MVGGSFGKGVFRCVKLCCGSKVGGARKMSALSSPPWLMLPPALEGGDMVDKFYDMAENKVLSLKKRSSGIIDNKLEIIGSSHGWLCLFNQRNCDMFLANPVSGRHIKLPFINCLPIPEENLKSGHGCVSKVIISGNPDEEEECRAMMIYGTADSLAFCCPGRSREWTPIGAAICPNIPFNRARGYEDFVYSSRHKQFFCLTEIDSDDLEGWDLSNPRSPRLDWLDEELLTRHYDPWFQLGLEPTLFTRPLRYLVFAEESDQLYMVTRHLVEQMDHNGSIVEGLDKDYPCKTIGFSVHKIDREGGKLVLMEEGSLDGLTIFVGLNHSFATSSSEFPHLKPNSIYFTTDRLSITPEWVDSKYGGHDIGIFDYEKRTISPCYYPCDVKSFKRFMPAPIWFTPTHP